MSGGRVKYELQVTVSAEELPPLREAMGDIQRAVARYYAATARGADLGDPVRTFLLKAQTLNDRFANTVRDRGSYKNLFAAEKHTDEDLLDAAKLIDAVRYARNVDQHVLHIVQPQAKALIGGDLGMRIYAYWEEIPLAAHQKLRPRTAKLKPSYDAYLQGREVTTTMLAVLRFYAGIAEDIVHRDHRGEWTGFPLTSQPGMATPLHPEEPTEIATAQTWLNNRPPNGDSRIICAQLLEDDTRYLLGLTFTGRFSFTPFVETSEQVNRDLELGFPYMLGDIARNLFDASEQFVDAKQHPVLASRTDAESWASPVSAAEEVENRLSPLRADSLYPPFEAEDWRRLVRTERSDIYPVSMRYESRRARRLNALVPHL